MSKSQYYTIGAGILLLVFLLIFGRTKPISNSDIKINQSVENQSNMIEISTDSLLNESKQILSADVLQRLKMVEQNIATTSSKEQKLSGYEHLIHFWADTGKSFLPYIWYLSERARLENSEKSLTFAGHLFLDRVEQEQNEKLRRWYAVQSKDLFERSLIINPQNDSSKIALGAVYLFGNIASSPMEGISKIKDVLDKDSTNIYGQMTLAMASLMSGQTEKAKERLETVNRLQPNNLQAIVLLGELEEQQGQKTAAIKWYSNALEQVKKPELRSELEKRINDLKK